MNLIIGSSHHTECSAEFQLVVEPIFALVRAVFIEPNVCAYSTTATCVSQTMHTWVKLHSHLLPVAPQSRLSKYLTKLSLIKLLILDVHNCESL